LPTIRIFGSAGGGVSFARPVFRLSLKEDRIALEYVAIDKVANLFFLLFAQQRNGLIRFNVRLWQVYRGILWHCYTCRVLYSIAFVNLAVAATQSAMTP